MASLTQTSAQTKPTMPAAFACAAMSASAAILIICTLSDLLGVLLITVLCSVLVHLFLLRSRPADGNRS